MKARIYRFFFALYCLISCNAFASTACPQFFAGGKEPIATNPKLTPKFRELCSDGFVVGHSGLVRSPLWSAEIITREHVVSQKGMARENVFHPDLRLPASERAELVDFVRSGFDRGHMTPSASAWTPELQHQTFALSNMVAQSPENNRGLHAHIESAVRVFAKKMGALYVISGPLFKGKEIGWINGRVAVPSHVFKLVYDPHSNLAAAYLEANAPGNDYKVVSVGELNSLAGFDFLPGVRVAGLLDLPKPKGRRGKEII